tara:strand:- start:1868 stop:2014 length:147 start_codon:yes stop_codon:yes gene_type:complete
MVSSLFMFMKISMTMMMFFALFVQNSPFFYCAFSALVVRVLAFALTRA